MRVVLDTNILIRANPGTGAAGLARELLLRVLAPPNVLVLSTAIVSEVTRVLRYPHVRSRWPLPDASIEKYASLLADVAYMVPLPLEIPSLVTDPDDDPILQTAILGRADVLCSRDAVFRAPVVEEVCRAYGIRVLDDVALMQELRDRL